jgi:HK97 family phage major capsid protein
MSLKTLQENRGSLAKQADAILKPSRDESRALTGDEASAYDAIAKNIDALDETLSRELRQFAIQSQKPAELTKGEARDVNRFSVGTLLRAMTENRTLDGVELEIVDEGRKEARAAGINSGGLFLPRMVVRRENRDMSATGTTTTSLDQGGMTIATEKRGLADDFFNASIARSLGATVLEGLFGNLDLPRLTAGTAPAKKAENASADETSPLVAMLQLTPHRLPAFIDIGEQLLLQSDVNIEAIIRSSLTAQMTAIQEHAIFHGGGTNEPTGIAGTSGIGSVVGGTNGLAPTWSHLVGLETEVDTDNALMGRLAYASNGQIRGKLKTTPKVASTDSIMLLDDRAANQVNGYPIGFSNAISRTLTKGSSSLASAIFFGNFADLILAYWGGISLELIRDSSNAITGQYRLVAASYYDAGVLRPKSFAAMLDALGA